MGDNYPQMKVAAVQASPSFLDKECSTKKACEYIREAGKGGAKLIGFPESFIPTHPIWFHFHEATGKVAMDLSVELFKNSVEIPGPETAMLCEAAREAQAYVVIGVCEKYSNTMGTMYNSQLFINSQGEIMGKHQKLMPTVGERLVHTGGYGDTLRAFQTEYGPISGLMCGENTNPLAVFAMIAEGTRVHFMGWPNHFPKETYPMRERVLTVSKIFSEMSKAFVISACTVVDEQTIEAMKLKPEEQELLRKPDFTGGSVIVGPDMEILAGPMGNEEGIIYADIDMEKSVRTKIHHDFAGHYNRHDVLQLKVNRKVPKIYNAPDMENVKCNENSEREEESVLNEEE